MDVIGFAQGVWREGDISLPTLEIEINGERLQSLALAVELPQAAAEGSPHLAGSYAALTVADIHGRRTHFLGIPEATCFDDGDAVLLGCPCGEWGCWPLTAQITATGMTVTWNRFRHGHRDWDYELLGPFVFSRIQYEEALQI